MTDKLGFTFYPKDWWTSETFYTLNPIERYFYLECLFLMYVNNGSIANNKVNVERRLGTTISDNVWLKVVKLMVIDGDRLTHKSVNKRLNIVERNRENGKKGGAPKGNNNAKKSEKTTQTTEENNPKTSQREKKENRKEIELLAEKNPPTHTNDFEKRQLQFYNLLANYVKTYGKEMVRAFYDYWREPNKSKSKMRWEQERTWELELRLKKWESNDFKFKGKNSLIENKENSKMVI